MSAPCTVALTPGALADLDRLDTFLRRKNPAAADRMLTAVTDGLCCTNLVTFGRPLCPDRPIPRSL